MPTTIKKWGGVRQNSGRKRHGDGLKMPMGCRVPPEFVEFVNAIRGDSTVSLTLEKLLLGTAEFKEWMREKHGG